MLAGIEIVLLIFGLAALFTGKMPPFRMQVQYVVRGWPARVMGVIGLLPIPLTLVITAVEAPLMFPQGMNAADGANSMDCDSSSRAASLFVCCLAITAIRLIYKTPVVTPAGDLG